MNEWIDIDFAVPPDHRLILIHTLYERSNSSGKTTKTNSIWVGRMIRFKNGKIKWQSQG